MVDNKKLIAVLIGATGLVGAELLDALKSNDRIEKIIVFSRKKIEDKNAKIENHVIDFRLTESYANMVKGDLLFCCLGTTMKVAGSKEGFIEVDYSFPVAFAKSAIKNGVHSMHIVTATGANATSPIFYNKVKGQAQEAIAALGFGSCYFYQPSMLIGERNENRVGERIGQKLMLFFDFFIPLAYKAISGKTVAQAMLHCALQQTPGTHYITSDEIYKIAKNG
jgi:uncharacterized protein YbjT (DUF2867 family)